jgi:hypothetical protein
MKLFIAKNLYNNVKGFLDGVRDKVTEGMSESEKDAYDLGVSNALLSIGCHTNDDYPVVCLDVNIDTEMTTNEVFERFDAECNGSAYEDDEYESDEY